MPVISATHTAPAVIVKRRILFPSHGIIAGIIFFPTDLAGFADITSLTIRQTTATRLATIVPWNNFPLSVFVRVARYPGLSDAVRCAAAIFTENFSLRCRKSLASHPGPVKGRVACDILVGNSRAGISVMFP